MGLHFYKNLWTGFAISKDHNAMSSTQRRVLKQQLRVACELSAEVPIFGWAPVAVYHFFAVPIKGHFTECFSDISIINGSYFNRTSYEWSMTASDTCASSSNTQTVHQCLDRIMLIKCTLETATFCTAKFRDYPILEVKLLRLFEIVWFLVQWKELDLFHTLKEISLITSNRNYFSFSSE